MTDTWPRPIPTIGDRTSAAARAADPTGWAFPVPDRETLRAVMSARRDIRRFRPDPVSDEVVARILGAAHDAPSVGHSQPWRFVVVTAAATRARAALLADRARLAQASLMEPDSARHLLDLDLEGIREAPLGLVVCCDRRTPAGGVLGRATFTDADMWSCACAIQNLWLAGRAEGLGIGWVTLFEPDDLTQLVGAPPGVASLGWLCVGWPDERPPAPGLERRGWSERLTVESVVFRESWPEGAVAPVPSHLALPDQAAVVAAHDSGDQILTPAGSLGVLDRVVDRFLATQPPHPSAGEGTLVLVASDHPVSTWGVSAYEPSITRVLVEAAVAGDAVGAVAAANAGFGLVVVDAGVEGPQVPGSRDMRPVDRRGDLVISDAMTSGDVDRLVSQGRHLAGELVLGGQSLFAVGEVGVGNTTVATALAAALLDLDPAGLVGLGAGSDSTILAAKRQVVAAAVARVGSRPGWMRALAGLGGGEIAVLVGFLMGAATSGATVILDGMVTGVAALVAVEAEPAVAAHLIAGQRSREAGHRLVLDALGLEPLLDLRLRAGEGVGAVMAAGLLRAGIAMRTQSARTAERAD